MGYVDLSADCGCTSGEEAGDGEHGGVFHPGDQGRRCEDGKVSGSDDSRRIFFSHHEPALVGYSFVNHVVKIALFSLLLLHGQVLQTFQGEHLQVRGDRQGQRDPGGDGRLSGDVWGTSDVGQADGHVLRGDRAGRQENAPVPRDIGGRCVLP